MENAKAVLKRKKGPNYVWGAKGPDNFDCSGFTRFVYKQSGLKISEASYQQAKDAKRDLKKEDLKPGDLIFSIVFSIVNLTKKTAPPILCPRFWMQFTKTYNFYTLFLNFIFFQSFLETSFFFAEIFNSNKCSYQHYNAYQIWSSYTIDCQVLCSECTYKYSYNRIHYKINHT